MQKCIKNTNHKTNINVVLHGLFRALSSYVAILNMRQTQFKLAPLNTQKKKSSHPCVLGGRGLNFFYLVHKQVTRETELFHLVHKTILFHLYCFSLFIHYFARPDITVLVDWA